MDSMMTDDELSEAILKRLGWKLNCHARCAGDSEIHDHMPDGTAVFPGPPRLDNNMGVLNKMRDAWLGEGSYWQDRGPFPNFETALFLKEDGVYKRMIVRSGVTRVTAALKAFLAALKGTYE